MGIRLSQCRVKLILRDEQGDEARGCLRIRRWNPFFCGVYKQGQRSNPSDVVYVGKVLDKVTVEVAIQYNDGYNEHALFANYVNTTEGGTHLSGFRSALTRSINDYARKSGLKENDDNLTGDDTRED